MDQHLPENFSPISLSATGADKIQRLGSIALWQLVLGLILEFQSLINLALNYLSFAKLNISLTLGGIYTLYIAPAIGVFSVTMFVLQLVFYFRYTHYSKLAVQQSNPALFNDSYKWLIKHSITAIVSISIHIVITLIYTIGMLNTMK